MSKSLFAKIGNAQTTTRSDHLRDGKGTLLIKKIECKELQDGATFIVEAKVISSESKGALDPVTKQPVTPNAVGSTIGYIQKLAKFQSAVGNVKAFTQALLGVPDAEGDEIAKALEELCSDAQPATGMLIEYETYQQTTKSGPNTGKVNTYPRFAHVQQIAKDIEARRKDLA